MNLYLLDINIPVFNCWRPTVFLPNKMFFHNDMNIISSSIFDTEKQNNRLAFCKALSTISFETTSHE